MLKALLILACCAVALTADKQSVTAEPNLEKRSALAIKHAGDELDAARKAYSEDKMDDFKRLMQEIGDLAELSYKSLEDTGKRARRNPKWFKRAELSLRTLIRKVDNLEKDVSVDDRETVGAALKRMQTVHERILHDIMTKK